MIPSGVQVFIAIDPIDMRWSFDRLAGIAEAQCGYDARCGALFVFFGKRRSALKVLFADGTGMCIFYKRLNAGTFAIPEPATPSAHVIAVEQRELEALLDGLAIERQFH